MDFSKPEIIGKRIDDNFDQLAYGKGYDHNWVLNKKETGELTLAAICYEPKSESYYGSAYNSARYSVVYR